MNPVGIGLPLRIHGVHQTCRRAAAGYLNVDVNFFGPIIIVRRPSEGQVRRSLKDQVLAGMSHRLAVPHLHNPKPAADPRIDFDRQGLAKPRKRYGYQTPIERLNAISGPVHLGVNSPHAPLTRPLMPSVLDGAEPNTKEDKAATKYECEYQALSGASCEQSVSDKHHTHKEKEGGHEIRGATMIDLCGCGGRTHERRKQQYVLFAWFRAGYALPGVDDAGRTRAL